MTTRLLDLFQAAPQPGPGGGLIQFLPMIFIFVVFYFLLIAPMRKKQKRQQLMLSQLKRGDEVVTASGILGRITALDDANQIVVLQIADNVKIIAQSGVSKSLTKPGATYFGSPAKEHRAAFRIEAALRQLPELLVEIKRLRERLEVLEKQLKK